MLYRNTVEENADELIQKIVYARKDADLSQKDLEYLSGVQQPIIARMERRRTDPALSTLLRILEPLGMTLTVVPQEDTPREYALYNLEGDKFISGVTTSSIGMCVRTNGTQHLSFETRAQAESFLGYISLHLKDDYVVVYRNIVRDIDDNKWCICY